MNLNPPTGGLALPGLRRYQPTTEAELRENRRLSVLSVLPDTLRKHIVALIAEFVGTFMFLFFAFAATQIANTPLSDGNTTPTPNTSNLLYISLAFGFSLAVNAWIFFRYASKLASVQGRSETDISGIGQRVRRHFQPSCTQ